MIQKNLDKKLNKEEIEKGLNDIFSAILNNREMESKEKYGEIINQLMKSFGDDIKEIDTFYYLIQYELDEALEYLIKQMYPSLSFKKLERVIFLYTNFNFVENQLESIISKKEGPTCSIDKCRWLINSYLTYLIEDRFPDMTKEKRCYWKPDFGSGEEWIEFLDSLFSFYYGDLERYFKSLGRLIGLDTVITK